MSETERAVQRTIKFIELSITDELRAAALAIEAEIVAGSPVDTGRFRANWVASVGNPSGEIIGNTDQQRAAKKRQKSTKSGKRRGVFQRPALVTGKSRWGKAFFARDGRIIALKLWLSNNLPYAIPLVAGDSDQAEPGWLEGAIRRGLRRAVRRRRVRV